MNLLHMNTMKAVYPSDSAHDLTWQQLSRITGGVAPSPRSHHSLTAWGSSLLLFGGLASSLGDSYNTTYQFSTTLHVWQQVSVAGGPILPRSAHTAVACAGADGCVTADGRPRLFIFGGWGLEDCGQIRPCFRHKNDLHALDLNNLTWTALPVNSEQPLPYARKGHSATLMNGTQMLVFGGSAWVPDPVADNSFGATTKHVNDLWRIDLAGSDGYTWHAVHTVGDAPLPREGHAAELVNGRYLVIHGGYAHAADGGGFNDGVHVLDTQLDPMVWSQPVLSGNIPTARQGHVSAVVGAEVFVFGGASAFGSQNDLAVLQLGVGNENNYNIPDPSTEYTA